MHDDHRSMEFGDYVQYVAVGNAIFGCGKNAENSCSLMIADCLQTTQEDTCTCSYCRGCTVETLADLNYSTTYNSFPAQVTAIVIESGYPIIAASIAHPPRCSQPSHNLRPCHTAPAGKVYDSNISSCATSPSSPFRLSPCWISPSVVSASRTYLSYLSHRLEVCKARG